jgi:hypothetical protein
MKKLAGCVWTDISSSRPPPLKTGQEVPPEKTKQWMLDFPYSKFLTLSSYFLFFIKSRNLSIILTSEPSNVANRANTIPS